MQAIIKPNARRLQCKDPRTVDNFIRRYEQFIIENKLLEQAELLESQSTCPLSSTLQKKYEEFDNLRCKGVALAERKCRKLRMGQVPFSPTVQLLRRAIDASTLLVKKAKATGIRFDCYWRMGSSGEKDHEWHWSSKSLFGAVEEVCL